MTSTFSVKKKKKKIMTKVVAIVIIYRIFFYKKKKKIKTKESIKDRVVDFPKSKE